MLIIESTSCVSELELTKREDGFIIARFDFVNIKPVARFVSRKKYQSKVYMFCSQQLKTKSNLDIFTNLPFSHENLIYTFLGTRPRVVHETQTRNVKFWIMTHERANF